MEFSEISHPVLTHEKAFCCMPAYKIAVITISLLPDALPLHDM